MNVEILGVGPVDSMLATVLPPMACTVPVTGPGSAVIVTAATLLIPGEG